MKGLKGTVAVGFAFFALLIGVRDGSAADTQLARGLDWLQAQVQSNGVLTGEDASLAIVRQVRDEAAHTLAQAGRTTSLPDLPANATVDLSTELLARRLMGLGAMGRTEDAAQELPGLLARANADGGFGGAIGQPSNPLDTSLALLALRAAGVTRDSKAQAAIGYLLNAANGDGTYSPGQPAYVTAYALQAFSRFRNDYSLATAIQRTRAALVALQVSGTYGDVVNDAVATIAFAQSGAGTDADALVAAIRSEQAANGSWQDDPYVTALALRALLLAQAAPPVDAGQIVGEVHDASSGLPIANALITLGGSPLTTQSGSTGAFVLESIAPGTYVVSVSRAGYDTYTGSAVVQGGSTTNLGRIGLAISDQTAVLRGRITDSATQLPLAGVAVQVVGAMSMQSQTDASGDYAMLGLPAGSYTVQVSDAGYQSLNQTIELPAKTAVTFSPALTPDGQTPPTTAELTGLVIDAGTAAPIAGAQFTVNGQTGTTDATGRFLLQNLTAGAFAGNVQATGYDTVSFSGVMVNGSNDLGRIALNESDATTRRTVVGTITSSATGQPIIGASLALNGTPAGVSDSTGQYRIDDTGSADVNLSIIATGFQPRTISTRLENPGVYQLDVSMDDLREGTFQVFNLRVSPASVLPDAIIHVTADIANLTIESKPALVLVRVLDSSGQRVAQLCGASTTADPEQCEHAFDPKQTQSFAADWKVPNLPAGPYQLAVDVVQPGTIWRDTPRGLVYGTDSRAITIKATLGLQGSVVPSPPVMIAGSPNGVDFSALVQNKGNAAVPAGEAVLRVTDHASGTLAFSKTVAMQELLPNDIAALEFGHWQPTSTGAQYDLTVTSTDPAVGGSATGEFYVGDAAGGEFTVTPLESGDGTQRVQATLKVTGIDNPTGQTADPLFTLVRQAVTRGGAYTGVQAINWQSSNNCLGCHIQTQSLYGMASSLGKADIDQATALYLQNSQSSNIQKSRAIYNQHPEYPLTQALLGLWSMDAWQNQPENFNARYRVAKYLYSRRVDYTADRTYWWRDHDSGWLVENPAPSATAVQGIAAVLRDAQRSGIGSYVEYSSQVRANANARMADITGGPDGRLYVLREDGQVNLLDIDSNTLSYFGKATGGQYGYGIALAPDGGVYVASGHFSGKPSVIERVTPSGSQVVFTLPDDADSIDFMPDGRMAILCYVSRRVYVGNVADGSLQLLTSGSLLPTQARSITALPDGSLLVSGSYTSGLRVQATVHVAPDGTQRQAHRGVYNQMTDVAVAADGSLVAGGGDAIYQLSPHEVVERFATGSANNYKVAFVGQRLFGIQYRAATTISELVRTEAPIAAELEQMRLAIEHTAHHFETYTDYGIPAQAFRLMMLAEARPFVHDTVLATRIDARLPELESELRAAQRSDGGWSRYQGAASDPLTTSIVGTALDYGEPDANDPVLRKTVQYLLTKQGSDGSWSGQYFSTRLGATSYVMAYLPKAVARLSGIDTGLGLEFASDVKLVDSSVAPTTGMVNADGSSSYFFDLGRINATGATFTFTLDLIAMKIDEWRKIATAAFLRFVNGFNGEVVDSPIAVPSVHAANGYQLDLVLNKAVFSANETVIVQPTVRNTGSTYTEGSLRYFIEDSSGHPVAELSPVAFTGMTTGSERTLPQPWGTQTHPSGDYRARVVLLSPDGQAWGEAIQPFRIEITSTGPQLNSTVVTDKATYDPFDTVDILGRVRNLTLNAGFADLTVVEVVTGPSGDTVFTAARQIAELGPSSTIGLTVPFNLVGAPVGTYAVTQIVHGADGNVLDTQVAHFNVRSSVESGSGLAGSIAAVPVQVEVGETTSLLASASNGGNAAFEQLPLVISVVDPASESVLATWTQSRDIPVGQSTTFSLPWDTTGIAPGDYEAVLQARVGSGLVLLAHGPVRVVEPPIKAEMSQSLSATGRVLVLMTCRIGHGAAEDLACTHDRATFVDALLTRLSIDHVVVISTDAFNHEYATGRYDTYWISGGAQKLANTLAEEVREATFQGDGLLVDGNHDSRNQILDTALGVQFIGELSGNSHQTVMLPGDFAVGSFDATGDALRYAAQGAHVDGRFDADDGIPAFLSHDYGNGKTVVAGFDLVAALAGSSSAAQAEDLLVRMMRRVMPPAPRYGIAGGYLTVSTMVKNLAKAVDLSLVSNATPPLILEDARPEAFSLTALRAEWKFRLDVAESRSFALGLRLPSTAGSYALESTLKAPSTGALLATNHLAIPVVSTQALADALLRDLGQLSLPTPDEDNARKRVVALVSEAMGALAGKHEDLAISTLLKAIDELAKVRSVSTAPYHVQLASLVKAARVAETD